MAKFNNKYRSESHRWQYWDYSAPGNYFLTIDVLHRKCILGEIVYKKMKRSLYGDLVAHHIEQLPTYHPRIRLDAWVVMPDHFHLLVTLKGYEVDDGRSGSVNTIHELYLRNHVDHVDHVDHLDHANHQPPKPLAARQYWYQKSQAPGYRPTPIEVETYKKHRRQMIISKMVGKLKMQTSKKINQLRKTPGVRTWLANYHDRVIRTEQEYQNTKSYIIKNPENW